MSLSPVQNGTLNSYVVKKTPWKNMAARKGSIPKNRNKKRTRKSVDCYLEFVWQRSPQPVFSDHENHTLDGRGEEDEAGDRGLQSGKSFFTYVSDPKKVKSNAQSKVNNFVSSLPRVSEKFLNFARGGCKGCLSGHI